MSLTDGQLEQAESLINAAIHELVFANQHCQQGDEDDAHTCLFQASTNIEAVAEMITAVSEEPQASEEDSEQ